MFRARAQVLLAVLLATACTRSFEPPGRGGPLSAIAERAIVPPLGTTRIDVTGGVGEISLSTLPGDLQSGPDARVDSAKRTYTAGRQGNVTDVIRVRDGAGTERQVHVSVGNALNISPQEISVGPNGSTRFSVNGGQPPYCFQIVGDAYCPLRPVDPVCGPNPKSCKAPEDGGSADSCIDTSGKFLAGSCGPTTQLVEVTDANGATVAARVDVGATLRVVASSLAVEPGQSAQLLPSGGVPPYSFAMAPHGNESFGSVDATGHYTAGPNPDERDTIVVTDFHGAQTRISIDVGDPSLPLPSRDSYDLYHGDFNGDGLEDLLVVSTTLRTSSLIAVSLGSPLGGISAPVFYPYSDQILGVLVGDFDGDGNDDIVLSTEPFHESSSALVALQLIRGQRGGVLAFTPPYLFPSGPNDPSYGGADVLDFRKLGGPVVVATAGGPFFSTGPHDLLLLGGTASGLQPLSSFPIGTGSSAVGPDVVNARQTQSGNPEAIVVRYADPSAGMPECPGLSAAGVALERISLGWQDGGFVVAPAPPWCGALPDYPSVIRSGVIDLNRDDRADVYFLAADSVVSPTTIDLLRSAPDGGWTTPERRSFGPNLYDSVAHTSRGDELDLAGSSDGVRLVDGDGGLVTFGHGLPAGLFTVTTGDFDDDHLLDFAAITDAPALVLLSGTLGGEIQQGRTGHLPKRAFAMTAQDVDGDGHADLFALEGEMQQEFAGTVGGRLSLEARPAMPLDAVLGARGRFVFAWTGSDGGGFIDASGFGDGGGPGLPVSGPPLVDMLPAGRDSTLDGRFLGFGNDPAGGIVPQLFEVLADGGVVAGAGGTPVSGFYSVPIELPGDRNPALAVLDLAGGGTTTSFAVYPAQGSGWSASPVVSVADTAALATIPIVRMASYSLHPNGPLDHLLMVSYTGFGNGCLDVIFLQTYGLDTGTLVPVGNGLPPLPVCVFPRLSAAAADFNHDGNTDLLVNDSTNAFVLLGDGHGDFTLVPIPIGTPSGAIAAGDFDGDGWTDISWSRLDLPFIQIALNAHDGGFY